MHEYSRTLFAHADRHRRTDTAAQVERLLEQSSAKDAQIAELKRRLSDMHAELRCGFLFRVGPRFDSRVLLSRVGARSSTGSAKHAHPKVSLSDALRLTRGSVSSCAGLEATARVSPIWRTHRSRYGTVRNGRTCWPR